jgi:hypothetical protein
MMIYSILKAGVVLSAAWCLLALLAQVVLTFRFGRRPDPSVPAGSAAKGVAYAFGPGMMPWAKESAAKHLFTWLAGVIYHIALFFAMTELGFFLFGLMPPPGPAVVIRVVLAAGLLCGLGLLVKRLITPSLKSISGPDDYAANILVNGFLLLAVTSSSYMWTVPLFFLWSIYLFLYIPIGKIKHCLFFIYTRILFGSFSGRRGVLPHRPSADDGR